MIKSKKIACIMSVLLFVISIGGNVFAEGNTSTTSRQEGGKTFAVQEKVKEKKAELQLRKADNAAFRAAVKEERDIVKENREANRALRQENTALRKQLSASLKELKAAGTVLDEETTEKLAESNEELKSMTAELKTTKGDIKAVADEKKEALKSLDYEGMKAAFEEIGQIQDLRNETLEQINSLLKEMISLLPVS